MSKSNEQKKAVFRDNFIKNWCKSSENHPEGWNWWKQKAQRDYRRFVKKETAKEIQENI